LSIDLPQFGHGAIRIDRADIGDGVAVRTLKVDVANPFVAFRDPTVSAWRGSPVTESGSLRPQWAQNAAPDSVARPQLEQDATGLPSKRADMVR